MCLISLGIYDLERRLLPYSDSADDMPTGIACPLCGTELYANADIEIKKSQIPAWCTNYKCSWRGAIHLYGKATSLIK